MGVDPAFAGDWLDRPSEAEDLSKLFTAWVFGSLITIAALARFAGRWKVVLGAGLGAGGPLAA